MDVLVIVGDGEPPERLTARATHVVRLTPHGSAAEAVAEVRGHIPREIGVWGAAAGAPEEWARTLHEAGFPVSLYSDRTDATAGPGVNVRAASDPGAPMDVVPSLLELVGNTPLVRLDRVGRDLDCQLLAKLEFFNPGGSVKDRPAVAMVDAAERAGLLNKGGTIVEPTSGNTGVGLAIVAARRRYRCIFVMPDKMAPEKIALLRAYGAEVLVCPTAVAPENPDSYYSVANRLAAEIPGAFQPNQYHNPENPASHERSTGPELWEQTAGRITHFVAGIGTGGTISGVGRYLKTRNPNVRVVGGDPEGSVYSGGSGRPYLVEGIGEDFWPTTYDPSVVDQVVMVSDRDSFLTARRVTREEGILVGGSAGTAVKAALVAGADLGPEHVVVVLIPDSGRGYLSKLYNDDWMADFGFLGAHSESTAAAVLARKQSDAPELIHVHPDETIRVAIGIMREYGVSQLPVVKAEPPLAVAEIIGAVSDRTLMERAYDDPGVMERPVADVMGPPLPTIGAGESIEAGVDQLNASAAVIVIDAGRPVGILTRSDVLEFFAARP